MILIFNDFTSDIISKFTVDAFVDPIIKTINRNPDQIDTISNK